ncbi:alpha/beta hydrolase family protein [Maritimibacter alexandrii]|uniref:alpha/beta hydrolase family protein n=1 Tax=Maritimibacter alexandrii TaxID=2570355 RepID=UPI001107BF0C|nr:prolyl oligopeptidase family serine peptidase [Maritimibacter alexandrii]
MALFEYFPNYVWNLSLSIAMASGAELGEIMDMSKPLLEKAEAGEDAGTAEFLKEWMKKANDLIAQAEEDEGKDRLFSAGDKLRRASLYLLTAERMQGHGHPGRKETFAKALECFDKYARYRNENCERVEIPYGDKVIPAYFTKGEGIEGEGPCVVFLNGLDSNKELLYWTWLPHELARRGISTLCVDQPGTGESIRLQGLHATYDSERWGTPVYEYAASRPDVDAARVGCSGISLGGYYVPRVVANEPRYASGAVWGANHNWAEVQEKRMRREGENPVPHYWHHVWWVFDATDQDDFMEKAKGMDLTGQMEKIKVPFLITHGENDRQIGLEYAHQSYDQLVNSPRREMKIFTPYEGGVEHVGADNMSYGRSLIADWFAETLDGHTK